MPEPNQQNSKATVGVEVPEAVIDEAHRKGSMADPHLRPVNREVIVAALDVALPHIEQAIRTEEREKVLGELLSDEAVRAGADAEFRWVNPHANSQEAAEERDSSCEPFKAGLAAALTSLPLDAMEEPCGEIPEDWREDIERLDLSIDQARRSARRLHESLDALDSCQPPDSLDRGEEATRCGGSRMQPDKRGATPAAGRPHPHALARDLGDCPDYSTQESGGEEEKLTGAERPALDNLIETLRGERDQERAEVVRLREYGAERSPTEQKERAVALLLKLEETERERDSGLTKEQILSDEFIEEALCQLEAEGWSISHETGEGTADHARPAFVTAIQRVFAGTAEAPVPLTKEAVEDLRWVAAEGLNVSDWLLKPGVAADPAASRIARHKLRDLRERLDALDAAFGDDQPSTEGDGK